MKYSSLISLGYIILANPAFANGSELTIYNQNFYFFQERKEISLPISGINSIELTDIPPGIEEASVKFSSITDPKTAVIEQDFRYDLVDPAKIWYKLLNKKIKIKTTEGESYEGFLISGPKCLPTWNYDYYDGGSYRKKTYVYTVGTLLISQKPGGGSTVSIPVNSIKELPELTGDFVIKPTLFWKVYTEKPGHHMIYLSYLAQGMEWQCDYNAFIDRTDESIDLNGWVSIDNHSGVIYEDAKVCLIAGDVHKTAGTNEVSYQTLTARDMEIKGGREENQFIEQPIFEYHQYDLQRNATLLDNETKQIELMNTPAIKVKKLYYYDGARFTQNNYMDHRAETYYEAPCNRKINVFLQFTNSKENNLGQPLPCGKVRVYKKDDQGIPRFIGEDYIDHTPKDEKIKLYMGDAFDLVGERIKTQFKNVHDDVFPDGSKNTATYVYDESFKIILRNHKNTAVEVIVSEKLWRWSNWRIIESTHNFTKQDVRSVEFPISIPANGETTVTYTVRYWWD